MTQFRASELQDKGLDTIEANLELGYEAGYRHFELPAQILKQLGIESSASSPTTLKKVEALEPVGIKVVERIFAKAPSEPTKVHRPHTYYSSEIRSDSRFAYACRNCDQTQIPT